MLASLCFFFCVAHTLQNFGKWLLEGKKMYVTACVQDLS